MNVSAAFRDVQTIGSRHVMKDRSLWNPMVRADAVKEGGTKGNNAMEWRQMKRMQDFGSGWKTAEAFASERASADGERSL